MARKATAPKMDQAPSASPSKAKLNKQRKATRGRKPQPYFCLGKAAKIIRKRKGPLTRTAKRKAPEKTVISTTPTEPSETTALTSVIQEPVNEGATMSIPGPIQPGPEGAGICVEEPASSWAEIA